MSADEALWLGHPVAHVAAYRERQRLGRKLLEAQRALRHLTRRRPW